MRKLAREAVIFMLLTPVVVFVGSFIYLYHDAHKPVAVDYDTLAKKYGGTPVPATPNSSLPPIDAATLKTPQPLPSPQPLLQPGETLHTPVPAANPVVSQARDPWSVVSVSQKPAPILELLGDSLLFGLYGFPVGFGFWAFYRVVRFAIKG